MITASDKAAEKLKDELIQKFLNAGLGFRIVQNIDESGHGVFSIKLDKQRPDDEVIVSHGIRIFLDSANGALLRDYELDYMDEPTCGFCLKNEKVATVGSQIRGGESI